VVSSREKWTQQSLLVPIKLVRLDIKLHELNNRNKIISKKKRKK
jgi:hypothetical protein